MQVKAIICDLDDTLTMDLEATKTAFYKFYELHRSRLEKNVVETYSLWSNSLKFHYSRYLRNEISFQEQRRFRIRELFRNETLSNVQLDELFDHYLQLYEQCWKLHDDVIPFLENFKEKRIAIVTNGNSYQQRKKISSLGIEKYIHELIISEEVKCSKPDPKIFDLACHRLTVARSESCFIGDDLSVDYLPSKQLGFISILVDRNGRYKKESQSDSGMWVIKSLNELPTLDKFIS